MQDDGQRGRVRDRPKMRMDAGLHRLVVIGHDRKHRIGAGGLGAPRQLDGLAGRIRSRAGNDADAAARDLDGGADDAVVLGRRQRGGFAGGFADDDRRDAGLDLAFAKFCECRQIEIVRSHRRAWEGRGCSPPARWRDVQRCVIGFHAAFSIWPKPCRYADSTRPCWHRTPASIRKPICSSRLRIFRQKPLSRESIRTAMAALGQRNCEIWASAASIAEASSGP